MAGLTVVLEAGQHSLRVRLLVTLGALRHKTMAVSMTEDALQGRMLAVTGR